MAKTFARTRARAEAAFRRIEVTPEQKPDRMSEYEGPAGCRAGEYGAAEGG